MLCQHLHTRTSHVERRYNDTYITLYKVRTLIVLTGVRVCVDSKLQIANAIRLTMRSTDQMYARYKTEGLPATRDIRVARSLVIFIVSDQTAQINNHISDKNTKNTHECVQTIARRLEDFQSRTTETADNVSTRRSVTSTTSFGFTIYIFRAEPA